MSKTHPERPSDLAQSATKGALGPSVRRHIGQNLRAAYADTLAAPLSQNLEALIKQLAKPKP